jgi:lysozyme family protein
MATFEIALEKLLKLEGGYSNNPLDPGGETNFGISKRFHPDLDIKNLTPEQAGQIYLTSYWLPIHGDEILDQELASDILHLSVLHGLVSTIKIVQHSIFKLTGNAMYCDGKIGLITLTAINTCNSGLLLAEIRSIFVQLDEAKVQKNPRLSVFIKGWIKRDNA